MMGGVHTRGRRRRAAVALALAAAVALVAVLIAHRDRPRTFPQLAAAAAAVPVPAGLVFQGEREQINDGPGFTTEKFEEVTRTYSTDSSCPDLLRAWTAALAAAHLRYTVADYPGAAGLRITLHRRTPQHLGITLGSEGRCRAPFIWAFNAPH